VSSHSTRYSPEPPVGQPELPAFPRAARPLPTLADYWGLIATLRQGATGRHDLEWRRASDRKPVSFLSMERYSD
jgi:hypothetical protein